MRKKKIKTKQNIIKKKFFCKTRIKLENFKAHINLKSDVQKI